MRPDSAVLAGGLPPKGRARVLANSGKQYAIYLYGGPEARPKLALPTGRYRVEWVSPISGDVVKAESVSATKPATELLSPKFDPDIALRVIRKE
jgi:hypothetical protein